MQGETKLKQSRTKMDDTSIIQLFNPLWADLQKEDEFYNKKPLLAHYTSIHVLEKILSHNEVWFSNPLFMNDISEVKFGVLEGSRLVIENDDIFKACKTKERASIFRQSYDVCFNHFANNQVMDAYIFCLSEHDRDDTDGLLSMWRGYGSNGKGVAIVFDTVELRLVQESPLIVAKVHYGSSEDRVSWLQRTLSTFARILNDSDIPDDKLYLAAWALFERIKLFSFFSKHHGFREEKEWRAVYLVDRDAKNQFEPMFHYWIGPRGVEPKLKVKIEPIEGLFASDLSLEKLVYRILLGPCISSPLTKAAVLRMMDRLGRAELKDRVFASSIPFRAA